MRALPSYSTRPPGVCTSMSLRVPVLRVNTRSVLTSPRASTRPVSIPKGTTAASILPQFGVVSTRASVTDTCANRNSRSTPAVRPGRTMPTLLVSGSAPPRPSICRASGEPMMRSSAASRDSTSAGRSLSRMNGPREVPPRMNRQGMARCMTATRWPPGIWRY